jgi:hypothetical protein
MPDDSFKEGTQPKEMEALRAAMQSRVEGASSSRSGTEEMLLAAAGGLAPGYTSADIQRLRLQHEMHQIYRRGAKPTVRDVAGARMVSSARAAGASESPRENTRAKLKSFDEFEKRAEEQLDAADKLKRKAAAAEPGAAALSGAAAAPGAAAGEPDAAASADAAATKPGRRELAFSAMCAWGLADYVLGRFARELLGCEAHQAARDAIDGAGRAAERAHKAARDLEGSTTATAVSSKKAAAAAGAAADAAVAALRETLRAGFDAATLAAPLAHGHVYPGIAELLRQLRQDRPRGQMQ